jgi:hypothetical protein
MCGRSFPSGIYAEHQSFEAANLEGKIHECPFCGFTAAYGNTDYRYQGK